MKKKMDEIKNEKKIQMPATATVKGEITDTNLEAATSAATTAST